MLLYCRVMRTLVRNSMRFQSPPYTHVKLLKNTLWGRSSGVKTGLVGSLAAVLMVLSLTGCGSTPEDEFGGMAPDK